jgi:hypothetical protein
MTARETAREHLRNGLSLIELRVNDRSTDPDILKDLVVVRDRIQAAIDLIEEVATEPKPVARAMRVFELL